MVIGILYRTKVSNSPAHIPKDPSPITATVFTEGRPKWAPTEAAME
jgi:hypothetical protein